MLEYHQPECNILPDHISNRMPCRNLRLYQEQTIADLQVHSEMRDLESGSLVGVSVVDLFILRDLMGEPSPPCATCQSVTEYKDREHQQDLGSQYHWKHTSAKH